MLCLNLCEIYPPHLLADNLLNDLIEKVEKKTGDQVKRVNLGSSFCSQFFLHAPKLDVLISHIARRGWPITLTLPVFSQKDLQEGKNRLIQFCNSQSGWIDEITCNDLGMLKWLENSFQKRINMGQLFFKDPRDIRYPDMRSIPYTPSRCSYPFPDCVSGIELSSVTSEIDMMKSSPRGMTVAIHQPYCYITTGHICKFASITSPIEQKFRPNINCSMQCSGIIEQIKMSDTYDTSFMRLGRSVFYFQSQCVVKYDGPTRVLYWPVDELNQLRGFCNENFDADQCL